ncbi:MAG: DUF169 domain-containing protein [Deltaproteobacteria bacterium]|jgi:hypothetical protein|nr:DUF169 domain-containing protein [Deltaproteobacteria bacterium]
MRKKSSTPFRLKETLELTYPVLGLWYEESVPPNAATVIEGRSRAAVRGCALFLVARAFKGDMVAFTPESGICPGASIGLGLPPNPCAYFPGGHEALLRYMSDGNESSPEGRAEAVRLRAEGIREAVVMEYLEGEGFKKDPVLADDYHRISYPPLKPETGVVVLRPIVTGDLERPPKVALMLADALQLSALVVLANFARPGVDNVRIPLAPGCSSLAAIPLHEAGMENPKAVVGLVDLAARRHMGRILKRMYLSMSVPWSLYTEMEKNVDSSFLSRSFWKKMLV